MAHTDKKPVGFDIGHPAHFHLFKNLISRLKKEGHLVFIHARPKDVLTNLLESKGWDYTDSSARPGDILLSAFGLMISLLSNFNFGSFWSTRFT